MSVRTSNSFWFYNDLKIVFISCFKNSLSKALRLLTLGFFFVYGRVA